MTANKPAADQKKATTVIANDPDDLKGTLKSIGGSRSDQWNNILANQTIQTLWLAHSDEETRSRKYSATVAALIGVGPKDELEGMMAVQLIAAHNAAMECYRRAMIGEQTFEGRREKRASLSEICRARAYEDQKRWSRALEHASVKERARLVNSCFVTDQNVLSPRQSLLCGQVYFLRLQIGQPQSESHVREAPPIPKH